MRLHIRKRKVTRGLRPANGFCDWVASLPFVVERSALKVGEGRVFAVECDLLDRDATFLVVTRSGWPEDPVSTAALVMPRPLALAAEEARLGVCTIPWPRDHMLFEADPDTPRECIEALVSMAYCAALP